MSDYSLHYNALKPIVQKNPDKPKEIEDFIKTQGGLSPELIDFIVEQGLSGHWYKLLAALEQRTESQNETLTFLKNQIRYGTAVYLHQLKGIHLIHGLFDQNNIAYVIYKGGHIREELYDPPSIHATQDIDVLISAADRESAVKLLIQEGFKPYYRLDNVNVEASFITKQCNVDLHWNVLRQRRSKIDLVEQLLANRIDRNGFYCLDQEHALFIMLVHPVFTKYLTTPHAYLSRIVDIYNWIEKKNINWGDILGLLEQSHLKTAAWLTGTYGELLTGIALPKEFMEATNPGRIKAAYLNYWVKQNLSTKYLKVPIIPKLFFTLPAQDSLSDALSFLISMSSQKAEAREIAAEFDAIIENIPKSRSGDEI